MNIQKYYPGGSFNPLNWFLNTYNDSEFSEAFAKARKNKDKLFKWKGKIYTTELISKEANDNYLKAKDYILNIAELVSADDISISPSDSVFIRSEWDLAKYNDSSYQKAKENYKDVSKKYFDPNNTEITSEDWLLAYEQMKLLDPHTTSDSTRMNTYRLGKSNPIIYMPYKDSIANRIHSRAAKLDLLHPILTTLSDPNYNVLGYFNKNNDKVYINLNYPSTAVHELAHYTDLDEVRGGKGDNIYQLSDDEDVAYYLNQDEVGAREWLRKYENYLNGINRPLTKEEFEKFQKSEFLFVPNRFAQIYQSTIYGEPLYEKYYQAIPNIYYKEKYGGKLNYLQFFK